MTIQIHNRLLIRHPLDSPLGRLSLAGSARHSAGVPFSTMRILGSYALVYLVSGSGRYADARGTEQKVSAGDLITVFPEIAHGYGPGARAHWDETYIVFDGPVFDLWRASGLLDDSRPVRRLEPIEYWLQRIESVAQTNGRSPVQAVCRLQEVLSEMHDYQQARGLSVADRAWLAQAKLLLELHVPLEDFALESVAGKMGISYVGFRKKFVRLANVSPAKFHMKSVMNRACDLIRREAPTNRQVARQLGFADEFHFSRRFKQLVGLSPREFRQQLRSYTPAL